MKTNHKRKVQHSLFGKTLVEKVRANGGQTGLALEIDPGSHCTNAEDHEGVAGIYGSRRTPSSNFNRTPRNQTRKNNVSGSLSVAKSSSSHISRFSSGSMHPLGASAVTAVHIVCAISENLARETCVSSLDAGSPISLHVTKQGNGQTYAETMAYLEILRPDEVLINEGRRNSHLARKVMELFNARSDSMELPSDVYRKQRQGRDDDKEAKENRYGSLGSSTVVKFISRSLFDQTKGAELLQKIAREETYDATMVEEYILLSSAHAVLHYVQQCLGATFLKNSVDININSGGNNRLTIDRSTSFQLELLVNAKSGKIKNSLIGTMDCTKTTVGSRLLRTNLMSPPARVDTINTRLELVDLFLSNADFFYAVLDHLRRLPDVDKMLSNVSLIPGKMKRNGSDVDGGVINERIASKGISSLVYIKSTLQALPSFAVVLKDHLKAITISRKRDSNMHDDVTLATDRSSLLVGLGGGVPSQLYENHLLQAIIFAMTQPALAAILETVSDVFTETTTFTRNANAMRHQECFALKCEVDGMMSVLRKAFLANVDDIYKKADEYAEVYGLSVNVRYTSGRGYFLSVPIDVGSDLPMIFLQPAKSGRFIYCTTEEINSLNTRAQDNVHDLLLMTHDRIQEVLKVARENYDVIATLCDAIALLDMCHSFADNVLTQSSMQWCRPKVTDCSTVDDEPNVSSVKSNREACMMVIQKGRYPIDVSDSNVVGNDIPAFIPNDTYASDDKFFTVITGINGSGKSTYLKQIAIITIMAHCGSYVTAESAIIPIRDRICCRIGNADDQEHNISTFLLEMKETAFICNNATRRSLVLVDELGRATSNEDGVAIAWSMSEYLLKQQAMTFFVTHYPQLSSLAAIYPSVQNIHLEASIAQGPDGVISYTHQAKPNACNVSTDYGVKLASACGWPTDVVDCANQIQDVVEGLLPEEGLCHYRPLQPLSDVRTKAYTILGAIRQDLQGLISDGKMQSIESIRHDLIQIQERRLNHHDDIELTSALNQLLYLGSHHERVADHHPDMAHHSQPKSCVNLHTPHNRRFTTDEENIDDGSTSSNGTSSESESNSDLSTTTTDSSSNG